MNRNNYPSLIITFCDTEIEVWYCVSLSKGICIMDMEVLDKNISKEDWNWICSEIKHHEQIEQLVADIINNED